MVESLLTANELRRLISPALKGGGYKAVLIKNLVSLGILYRDTRNGKKAYRLNPTIAHKGAKNYKKSLADYRDYQKEMQGENVETTIVTN